jgi:hypothetical protein
MRCTRRGFIGARRRVRGARDGLARLPFSDAEMHHPSPTNCHWRFTAYHLDVDGLPQTVWRPAESITACAAAASASACGWGGRGGESNALHQRSHSAKSLLPNCRAPRELHRTLPHYFDLTTPACSRVTPPSDPRPPPVYHHIPSTSPTLLPPPQHVQAVRRRERGLRHGRQPGA